MLGQVVVARQQFVADGTRESLLAVVAGLGQYLHQHHVTPVISPYVFHSYHTTITNRVCTQEFSLCGTCRVPIYLSFYPFVPIFSLAFLSCRFSHFIPSFLFPFSCPLFHSPPIFSDFHFTPILPLILPLSSLPVSFPGRDGMNKVVLPILLPLGDGYGFLVYFLLFYFILSLLFSARCNIYISRLCHDASPSVRLSVCDGSALEHYS